MNKDKINPSTLIGVGILRKFALAIFWIILDLQNSCHADIRGHLYQGSGRLKALGKSYIFCLVYWAVFNDVVLPANLHSLV